MPDQHHPIHPAPTGSEVKPGPKGDELELQKKDRPEKPELHQDDKPKDVSGEDAERLPRNDADHPDFGAKKSVIGEQVPYQNLESGDQNAGATGTITPHENAIQSVTYDGEPSPEVPRHNMKQAIDHFETYEEGHETAVNKPLLSHEHPQQGGRVDAARANPNAPMPVSPPAGQLGSGSKAATGNPAEDGQDDKGAIQHQQDRDGVEVHHGTGGHNHPHVAKKVADTDNPETPAKVATAHTPNTGR